jgi:hypothetical protein
LAPETLHRLAERCRHLLTKAVVPEVREQLRVWAVEFDACADAPRITRSDTLEQRAGPLDFSGSSRK